MTLLTRLSASVQAGDTQTVRDGVAQALAADLPPQTILNEGLIAAMDAVGRRFQAGELYIPQMLIAARAMHAALALLKPKLVAVGARPAGRVVLATVHNDLHDIGKNLVGMMLQGKGFEVLDLGINVPVATVVAAVGPDVQVVALSALLSTTRPFMAETVAALRAADLPGRVKVLVGGGAVTREFAESIGADAYAPDAVAAADAALALIAAKRPRAER